VARSAWTLRALHDRLQSLQPLGSGRRMGQGVRGLGGKIAEIDGADR